MDIYDRILVLEEKVEKLQQDIKELQLKLQSTQETSSVRIPRLPKKTEYFPKVTEELAIVSKLDPRSEDTTVSKRSPSGTDPRLRAAISAVSRAVEVAKDAQLLVEEINHLSRTMMEDANISPKGTFGNEED